MIELNLYGTRFRICFSFFAVTAFMGAVSQDGAAIYGLIACLLHECGHYLLMKLYGVHIKGVTLYGAGIMIIPEKRRILSLFKEITVLLAGCTVNFLLFLIFGETPFGYVNLFLCIFNLIPSGHLDGGRLLSMLLSAIIPCNERNVINICRVTGCISALLLPLWAWSSDIKNPTVYIAGAVMLISALING